MTLRGTIQKGHVQLDAATDLPDGTPVDVQPRPRSSLVKSLLRHAARDSSLPKDYGAELDHYLYGTPKRSSARKPATKSKARVSRPTKVSKRRGKGRGR